MTQTITRERRYGHLVDSIMRYEDGSMDETEAVQFFSDLIQSGMIEHLQGSYQRGAEALKRIGYLDEDGSVLVEIEA